MKSPLTITASVLRRVCMVHAVIDALVSYDSSGDHIDNVAHGAKEPHAREKCERCRIEDALPGWGKKVLGEKKHDAEIVACSGGCGITTTRKEARDYAQPFKCIVCGMGGR